MSSNRDLIPCDLQVLGFGEYVEEVYAAYEQHKYETMVKIHYTINS